MILDNEAVTKAYFSWNEKERKTFIEDYFSVKSNDDCVN